MCEFEVNNLMKGDYVSINTFDGCKIIQVTSIETHIITGKSESGWHLAKNKDVSPISITKPFLEENGFLQVQNLFVLATRNDIYKHAFFLEYNLSNCTIFINDGIIPKPVQYIHELQHIFRICGLDGNIKIDKL